MPRQQLPCVLLLILLVALASMQLASASTSTSTAATPAQDKVILPQADPDDVVRVMYLEAPLFKLHLGDALEKVNLFHVGIGFENLRSGENWTVDYIATVSVMDSVFPLRMGDRGLDLTWKDGGHVVITPGIDEEYWTRFTDMYEISGDVFNRFFCWAPTYNASQPHYLLFDIFDNERSVDEQVHAPIKAGHTCINFCWTAFQVLHNLGGTRTREADTMKRDLMYLVTNSTPESVDPRNVDEVQELREFYEKWLWIRNIKDITWEDALNKTLSLFRGRWHYHYRDPLGKHSYYRVNLVDPWIGISYRDVVIPKNSDPRAPQNVSYSDAHAQCAAYIDRGSSIPPYAVVMIVAAVVGTSLLAFAIIAALTLFITGLILRERRKDLSGSMEYGDPNIQSTYGSAYMNIVPDE